MDIFSDTAAVFNYIVSTSSYEMLRWQILINLPPDHLIIAI